MKKTFVLLLLSAILFRCKKENDFNSLRSAIAGTWELRNYSCGECTTPNVDYSAGNGNLIIIYANGNFERRQHDTLVFKGSYVIDKSIDCPEDIIFTTNETSYPEASAVSVNGAILYLSTSSCLADGASRQYQRL